MNDGCGFQVAVKEKKHASKRLNGFLFNRNIQIDSIPCFKGGGWDKNKIRQPHTAPLVLAGGLNAPDDINSRYQMELPLSCLK